MFRYIHALGIQFVHVQRPYLDSSACQLDHWRVKELFHGINENTVIGYEK